VSGQHDEQALYRCVLGSQHLARIQVSKNPMRGQPRQLFARRPADGLMRCQPIDQIGFRHEPVTPVGDSLGLS